jgi:hypothetical protein
MTDTIEQFAARVAGVLHRTDVDVIRPLLLREMTAFLAQHRQIVEVTGEDYAEATRKHYTGVVPELYARRVEVINARLRARAVPASDEQQSMNAAAVAFGCRRIYEQLASVGIETDEDGEGWTYATEPMGPQPVATLSEAVQKLCEASYNDGVRAVPASRPALDVEAVAEMLVAEIDRQPANEYRDVVRDFVAAHWPRHATDTGTTNRAAVSSSLVDATEMAERFADDHMGTPGIGTREFARRWFAEHWPTTYTGWVQVPTTQTAGELVVSEDGWYAVEYSTQPRPSLLRFVRNMPIDGAVTRIRRIDTDAPTTWIERTPTTTRAWTAESVQACVGRTVIKAYDAVGRGVERWGDSTPQNIADCYNRWGVVAFYVLPGLSLLPEPPK